MSAKPSPFTSPAELTLQPLLSPVLSNVPNMSNMSNIEFGLLEAAVLALLIPLITKPPTPAATADKSMAAPPIFPNTT